jgi:murein DD-endopeptidase MepM/ murein hydrolase activator NlpD
MRLASWLQRLASRSPRSQSRSTPRRTLLRVESLEDRVTPDGTITLYNAFLVDANNNRLTAPPDKGEEVFVQADFTTQNLPADASYRVVFNLDGVTLQSYTISFGAGHSQTENWYWYLGGWYASPGTHNVTVTIDPTTWGVTSRSFDFTPVSAPDLPQKFVTPLGGTPFQTWGISDYVDVDPRAGTFSDFNGGPYTYDGHAGHDMVLSNFGSMDAGVPDLAAAAGTVVAVQDGNYDRNTMSSNAPANYVEIDHGNGWHTFYYHLRTDTILVHVGDTVVAGQVLGLAGSSGNSTGPHEHFEVRHNGDIVEPEYDPSTYWIDPLPYQGSVDAVLDSLVTSSHTVLVSDLANEERPVSANVFSQAGGQQITAWFEGYTRSTDTVAFRFYKPDGTHYPALDTSFGGFLSRDGWYYYYNTLPANLDLGTWHVSIQLNGIEMARDPFVVTTAGAGAAHVSQGGTYVPNGRTTPLDFGTVAVGSPPPQRVFTISNPGSATLTLSNLVLPAGFSLVGSFPSSVPVGATATFTVQIATDTSGTDAGMLQFNSSDPNAPTYRFNIKGTVSGGYTGAIHGQVFHDLVGDGIERASDAGLVGWTVSLINPADGTVLATTTTSYNGYYAFLNVAPGSYRVRETLQSGYDQTTGNPADVAVDTADVLVSPIGVGVDIPTHFVISAPANITAGAPFTFTVTAENSFGHPVPGYTGTVVFASTDVNATLPSAYTFTSDDAGVHTFTGTSLQTAGVRFLIVSDSADPTLDALAPVSVAAAAADHFLVTTTANNPDVAGTYFDVTVTVQDAYGNTVPGYTGTIYFSSADPAGGFLPGPYTFQASDAGQHTFAQAGALFTAGIEDVTVMDEVNNLSGTTNVNVVAGAAVAFMVMAPANAGSGTPFDVTIVAVDAYGNTDTNYTGTIRFTTTDSDPGVVLPPDYTFQSGDAGMVTFPTGVTLITSGQQTLTVTDLSSGVTGSSIVTL